MNKKLRLGLAIALGFGLCLGAACLLGAVSGRSLEVRIVTRLDAVAGKAQTAKDREFYHCGSAVYRYDSPGAE